MNRKAKQLGMKRTRFFDSSGLNPGNRSTALDLVKLVNAAYDYPTIRRMTTSGRGFVREMRSGRIIKFMNTNRLVRRSHWDINVSKTGYIRESGYCLVMQANIASRPMVIVLLKSRGRYSKFGDANRIRRWITRAVQKRRRSRRGRRDFAVRF
jgi:D-alanyl-D-alanine endopeptidase (penicillin-binding protein 7)